MDEKALHYTPALQLFPSNCNLTNSRGFCLNCAPAIGETLLSHRMSTRLHVGRRCPLHRIRFTRGSARPFE